MAWRCVVFAIILSFVVNDVFLGDQLGARLAAASRPPKVYSNDFIVVMHPESEASGSNHAHAERLARQHGFENRGTVSAFAFLCE